MREEAYREGHATDRLQTSSHTRHEPSVVQLSVEKGAHLQILPRELVRKRETDSLLHWLEESQTNPSELPRAL